MGDDQRNVSLASVIDSRLSPYQISIFLMCAMVVFLDGIDTQVVGIGAPLIGRELHIDKALFGWVFSAGTLGATIGAFACGVIADKIGRKKTLIVATLIFGLCTLATAQVRNFEELLGARFFTGLGLGGAVPCFVALTSEYAPAKRRATIVSLLWAAFPLGAALGALINSYIVGAIGWRPLFVVWGLAPIVVAAFHLLFLPESVRLLLAKGAKPERIAAIMRRLDGRADFTGVRFTMDQEVVQRTAIGALFGAALLVPSLALSFIAFVVFGLLNVGASWTPSLLTPYGFSAAAGALIVAFNGFGSFLGTTAAGFLLERIGIVRTTAPALIGAAIAFLGLGLVTSSFQLVAAASFASGFCLGVGSSSMIALAALIYPTAIRSTGIGWSMGMGRFGSVVAPVLVGMMVRFDWQILAVMAGLAVFASAALPCVLVMGRYSSRQPAKQTYTNAPKSAPV